MINIFEVNETNKMIEQENLDVRTITMGISLLDCIDSDLDTMNEKIYNKITTKAKDLVATGDEIAAEFGIPVVNKRVSVTPIALVGGVACHSTEDFVSVAKTLDKAAKTIGVNFIGGYSALVSKGMTPAEELLIRSIPQALAVTERVCSSVNVGSTKTGINMDAVKLMGEIVLETAEASKEQDSLGCQIHQPRQGCQQSGDNINRVNTGIRPLLRLSGCHFPGNQHTESQQDIDHGNKRQYRGNP